jgi:hypothetical protein
LRNVKGGSVDKSQATSCFAWARKVNESVVGGCDCVESWLGGVMGKPGFGECEDINVGGSDEILEDNWFIDIRSDACGGADV